MSRYLVVLKFFFSLSKFGFEAFNTVVFGPSITSKSRYFVITSYFVLLCAKSYKKKSQEDRWTGTAYQMIETSTSEEPIP